MPEVVGNRSGVFSDRIEALESLDAAAPELWNTPHQQLVTNDVLLQVATATLETRVNSLEQGGGTTGNNTIDDNAVGNRTINPGLAPSSNGPASLTQWLSFLANRIKAIVGSSNWYDAPQASLNDLDTRLSALEGAGGSGLAYDISGFHPGVMSASGTALAFVAAREVDLPAGASGSARASVAAGATTTLQIRKNGSSVGSITFNASNAIGVVSVPSSQTLAAGDTLEVVGPASADANLANISITLTGAL